MPAHNIVVGQRVQAVKLQRAKELRRQMTEAERRLWRELRAGSQGGLHFRRQQVIDGFIVDFYCHAKGLVVELDGGVHEGQMEYDAERDMVLAARGLRVLRIANADVRTDIAAVLARSLRSGQALTPFPMREGGTLSSVLAKKGSDGGIYELHGRSASAVGLGGGGTARGGLFCIGSGSGGALSHPA